MQFFMGIVAIVLSVGIMLLIVTAKIANRVDENKRIHPGLALFGQLSIFLIGCSVTGLICLVSIQALDPVIANGDGGILDSLATGAYIILGYFGLAIVFVGGFVAVGTTEDLAKVMIRRKAIKDA